MAVKLISTGIQFPDNSIQTSAGISSGSRVIFKGYFSAATSAQYVSFTNLTYTTLGYIPAIDSHSGFTGTPDGSGKVYSYTIPVSGFYHISGMANLYAQWNGSSTDTSGRFREANIYIAVNGYKIEENDFATPGYDHSVYSHWGACVERTYHFTAGDEITLKAFVYKYSDQFGAPAPGYYQMSPSIYYTTNLCGYYIRSKT